MSDFNKDNAFNYLEKILTFGVRPPGYKSHSLFVEYLKNEIANFADETIIHNFPIYIFGNEIIKYSK